MKCLRYIEKTFFFRLWTGSTLLGLDRLFVNINCRDDNNIENVNSSVLSIHPNGFEIFESR